MNMTVQKNGCISHILKSHWNRNQIKGALLKCAEENENKPTFTGCVVVSSVCRSAVERIEELEEMLEKVKKGKLKWVDYDAGEDAYEDTHEGHWEEVGE